MVLVVDWLPMRDRSKDLKVESSMSGAFGRALNINRFYLQVPSVNFAALEKNKIWLWTAVDHFRAGILGRVLG